VKLKVTTLSNFFQWDAARLGLQIREMDDGHKVLVDLMNRLHTAHEAGARVAEQIHILEDLAAATRKHFAEEEIYMERIGFPGLRIHRGVHVQLLDKLAHYHASAKAQQAISDDLFMFFKMWLSAHICGIDSKYAQHAKTARSA
jgi:hemerythrin-like metal-binding protein